MMTPKKFKIGDSITLSAISTDKFKTAILSLSLTLPADPHRIACNSLLSGVMRRGTEKYPSCAALNLVLDELYATTVDIKSSVRGKNLVFTVSAELLDNTYVEKDEDLLGKVLEVLSQLLMHPETEDGYFCRDFVEKEKAIAIDAINSTLASPRAYADDLCNEILYRNDSTQTSLGALIPIIESLDEKKLYSFYRTLIEGSSLDIFYVGSEDIQKLQKAIRMHFEDTFGGSAPSRITSHALPQGYQERRESLPVKQGKLVMAFRGADTLCEDGYFASILLNNIFGALPSSKLFMNVRERLSLCYYCSSSYSTYTGDIRVCAGIDNKDMEMTVRQIMHQLDQIRKGEVNDDELSCAKASVLHGYRQIYDYPSDLLHFYTSRALFGICISPEEASERILAVTKQEIVDAAKKLSLDALVFVEGTLRGGEDDDDE